MRSLGVTTVLARLPLLLARLALVGSAGCTLFSGWSDLQDGTTATADAGPGGTGTSDSGADSTGGQTKPPPDSGGATDSSAAGSDASSVVLTVACGSTRCTLGDSCCAGIAGIGASTCVTSTQTCGPTSTLMSCSDSSQCTASLGHTAQCCQDDTTGVPSVSCRTTCTGTGNIVCDPTLASPTCPTGTTCQPSEEFSYNTCQ
ncbi:MAG: hypothetical protein ACLQVI_43810 [Polyangiaceae bacterium]